VLLSNGAPSRDHRRRAGLLHAGPGAVITGLDALALHGMARIPQPNGPVPLLVPLERRVSSHGLVLVERTSRLPEPTPGRWQLAPLDRAVLDFVRRIRDRDQIRSAIAEVVQRGRCTPAELGARHRGRAAHAEAAARAASSSVDGAGAASRAGGPAASAPDPRTTRDEWPVRRIGSDESPTRREGLGARRAS